MGMPINSYHVLRVLAEGRREQGAYGRLADVLAEQFPIIAVVVHDPHRHRDFDQALARDFSLLDELTGTRLLFFALVEAAEESEERRAGARQRGYFTPVLRALANECAYSPPLPAMATEIASFAAATSLGIGLDELPCVVVFRPGAAECVWFPTDPVALEKQLGRLARAAENSPPFRHRAGRDDPARDDSLEQLLARWGLAPEGLGVLEQLPAAHGLLEIVAAAGGGPNARRLLEEGAASRARRRAETSPIAKEMRTGPELDDAAGNRGRADLVTALMRALLEKPEWPWPAIAEERMEYEAFAPMSAALVLHAMNHLDWSPVVVCYGTAFEAEINASVVQHIRGRLGIDLPEFFKRHQPGRRAAVFVNAFNGEVDFNVERERKWQAPELGRSEAVARQLGSEGFVGPREWAELLQRWGAIRRFRNAAAHPGVVPRGDADACRREFSALVESHVLTTMLDWKERLRGFGAGRCVKHPAAG